MDKAVKDSVVSLRVPAELRADLETIARVEDRKLHAVMTRALKAYVEQFKQTQKPKKN